MLKPCTSRAAFLACALATSCAQPAAQAWACCHRSTPYLEQSLAVLQVATSCAQDASQGRGPDHHAEPLYPELPPSWPPHWPPPARKGAYKRQVSYHGTALDLDV